jgi:hypothetical protein
LAPGESTVAYVLVSYPALDANGKNVTGAAAETWDDLVFNYDIWVQATEGSTARLVYDERSITARNELSALANKITPNTTAKVPTQYLDAIQAALGWRPQGAPRVDGATVTEGIWYDLGTVVHGFDNNGDLMPDYNAWLQPVGDATRYDASAQRMVKNYGLVIVKLRDGTEKLIPFEDQLYFQNLPEDNTGAVGLVFYEFLPTQYGVSSALTPYQEVASGYDNEKFNGDFGTSGGLLTFSAPSVAFDKSGPSSLILTTPANAQASYTLSVTNNEPSLDFGNARYGLLPVLADAIPAGTTYVSGSAAATTVPSGASVTIRYSTDQGSTWVDAEPSNAASVTNVQWWLDRSLRPAQTFAATFSVAVPWSYSGASLENCGGVSLGGGEYALQDCVVTAPNKNLKIGDTVFKDDGTGGGTSGDGVRNGGELGLASIGVQLYADVNGDGLLDAGDDLLQSTTTDSSGGYLFTGLNEGKFIVVLDKTDADRPAGWVPSTQTRLPITLTNADNLTADFGFAPSLDLTKTLVGTSPINEGTTISFALSVENRLKPEGYVLAEAHTQDLWLSSATGTGTGFSTTASQAAGATTGDFASTATNGAQLVGVNPIDPSAADQTTPITHVEAVLQLRSDLAFRAGDSLTVDVIRQGTTVGTFTLPASAINAFVSASTTGYVTVNVSTVTGGWNWADLTASTTGLTITRNESGSGTDPTVYIDRFGFRVTSRAAEDRSGSLYWSDASTSFKVGPTTGGEIELLMTGLPAAVENAAFDDVNDQVWISYGSTIV